MTGNAPQSYYFLLSYWGDEFRDYLCRLALPSLLAPGNIPALRDKSSARLLIATTEDDWRKLNDESIFQAIAKEIVVEFLFNPPGDPPVHKYVRMSRGHAMLAERCFRDKAIAININPDSIYPDGCIAEAQRLATGGAHVILCVAVRFEMDGVERELSARGLLQPGRPLCLPMRDAVKIGLHNLHAETKASNWTADNFGALNWELHERKYFLTCCYWEIPGEDGIIIITHNWAPFLVDYGVLGAHDTSALDGRNLDGTYIFENFPKFTNSIKVVTDSDSLFLLGLTPAAEVVPANRKFPWRTTSRLGEWARGYVLSHTVFDPGIDQYRRSIYQRPVRWHSKDINVQWQPIEVLASRIIKKYAARDARLPLHDDPPLRKYWYYWVWGRLEGFLEIVFEIIAKIRGVLQVRTRFLRICQSIGRVVQLRSSRGINRSNDPQRQATKSSQKPDP